MNAYIIDAVRSPRGRGNDKGALRTVKPAHLLAQTLQGLAQRTQIDVAAISDVMVGCVTQTGEQGTGIGKVAVMAAGWPDSVSALTINRYCASGLAAVNLAALYASYTDRCVIGAGLESMSRVPMLADKGPLFFDTEIAKQVRVVHIGLAADAIATVHRISRAECDAYALQSQSRAAAARAAGRFAPSLVPIRDHDGNVILDADETIRADTTLEKLAAMAPAFAQIGLEGDDFLRRYFLLDRSIDHVHHMGNAPATADGAAAVLLAPASMLDGRLRARARVLGIGEAAIDPVRMLTGAVEAAHQALAKAGLKSSDIGVFEVNEAFAAPTLQTMQMLEADPARFNINGGAIALGHPMGATGAMLVSMLLDALEERDERYGLAAAAGAAGLASAIVVERL